MTGKVQKIREWVKARLDENTSKQSLPQFYGMMEEDARFLDFLDSLQKESVSIWHDASEKPELDDLLIETNDGRIIHRQSINNYGMVKRWAYTSALLNLDNSCNLRNNSQEEPVSVWHDANQQPTMYRKYLVRYSDGRVSGSWERHDDGFIPWKDVVKEHGFTHWCYVEDLIKL